MSTINLSDHTIGFNMGGTWVEFSELSEDFDVSVEEIQDAIMDMDLDWIGDDLSNRAEALIREELVDIFGESKRW